MVQAIDYALLIGEMEGVLSKLRAFGSVDDVVFIEKIKMKYYNQYVRLLQEEREES